MKGLLSEGALPGIMRELYVGRRTGSLQCFRGDERRSLRFRRGTIIHADTSVVEDHLGEVLVRKGVLSQEDLERATAVVTREKKRLGIVLRELGIVDKDRLEASVGVHVHEILTKLFSWNEGSYEFQEEPEGPLDEELTLRLSTGELILEAVRQIQDPDVIRYALGDIDRVLAPASDPLLRFQKIALSPTDGFVLSRVDGTLSAREVVQMAPLSAEETQRSLFGLLCTGVIEYLPGPSKAPAKPAPKPHPAPPAEAPSDPPPVAATPAPAPAPPPPPAPVNAGPPATPSPPAVTGPGTTPPPAAAEATPAAAGKATERRQEILDAHENLKAKTHFEVLGISREATEAQVKEAYFRLAKRFHPDVHHDVALGDLRDKLEAVFIRLGEAYEVLRNARTRASYEEGLAFRAARAPDSGSAAPGASAAPAPPPPDPAAEQRAAEEAIRRAEKLYEQEKYWDAIQALEPVVEVVEGRARQRGQVLLARAYLKNPKWVKKAEEVLLVVAHDDPQNVEAPFILGTLYRDSQLPSRAQAMFRKVLELKPDHEEARAELGGAPPPSASGAKGGLIRKLFKKS
jgi:hypothetical protein